MPEQKKAVVPRLRFPEFRDAGPWEVKPLYDLAVRLTERNKSLAVTRILTNSAEHGVVDQREFFDKDIAQQEALENYFLVDNCDFVYNPRVSTSAPVGPISINRLGLGVMSPLYTVFRFKRGIAEYYAFFFKTSAWHSYLLKAGNTGARHDRIAISTDDFMAMPVPEPTIPEQQKIADCLSSLDELIELQAKQLEALQAHKQGLMQQFFPCEGETTPRLRFPEFRDAGPWEIRTIEDIAEKIAQGGTPDTTVPEFWNGEIPWITPAEMGDDALHHYTKQTVRALSTIGLQNSSAEILPAYSVIVSSRAPIGYVTINTVPMATNQGCKGIVPKQQIYHEFLYYSLLRAKRQLNDLGAGAGFKEISASSLKKLKILMPERAEQQKIADCLSSLDELIELQARQLEALQTHKKGLMQQLFPQEIDL